MPLNTERRPADRGCAANRSGSASFSTLWQKDVYKRQVQFAEPCDILRNPATEFVDRLVTRKRTVYAR